MFSRFKYTIRSLWRRPPSETRFHQGINYQTYLKQIHDIIRPSSYLEIGVSSGGSLTLSNCPSVAIDPEFKLSGNPAGKRSSTFLFQMKSDDFFAQHDLRTFLPNGVDFAFLDGMHLFEYLLRDFINTEKYSHSTTIVGMHDCCPINTEITNRDPSFGRRSNYTTRHWWTGDVWKLLPILRHYRPDLGVKILDCPPTGLVLVTALDPKSTALVDAYDEIIAKYLDLTLDDFGFARFGEEFSTINSRLYRDPDAMHRLLKT